MLTLTTPSILCVCVRHVHVLFVLKEKSKYNVLEVNKQDKMLFKNAYELSKNVLIYQYHSTNTLNLSTPITHT